MTIFKRKSANTIKEISSVTLSTVEVLKGIKPIELAKISNEGLTLRRKSYIDDITNRRVARSIPIPIMDALIANDFRWFVPVEFLSHFGYHATLLSPKASDPCVRFGFWSTRYPIFDGDIPDAALSRITLAKEIGLTAMTVHSMQPMPVSFIQSDPVVIGWHKHPRLQFWDTETGLPRLGGWEASLGVIIAAWDDKGVFSTAILKLEYGEVNGDDMEAVKKEASELYRWANPEVIKAEVK